MKTYYLILVLHRGGETCVTKPVAIRGPDEVAARRIVLELAWRCGMLVRRIETVKQEANQ